MPGRFAPRSLAGCCTIAALVFLGDQISKCAVVKCLALESAVELLPFFSLVRVENSGVTFGLLRDVLPPFVFVIISLIIVVSLCIWAKNNPVYRFPVSLIVGGAFGNLVDRIVYKAVIDFLDFHLLSYHWPAFNIADSSVVLGVGFLMLSSQEEEKKMKKKLSMLALMVLAGCGGYENEKVDVNKAKENNPLLVPPCLDK